MNEKDLMIGNWVYLRRSKVLKMVVEIKPCECCVGEYEAYLQGDCRVHVEELNPIKITDKLLKDIGLTYTETSPTSTYYMSHKDSKIQVSIHNLGAYPTNEVIVWVHNNRTEIKYVHELQNLITVLKL